MKETVKIALLALIAGTLIYMAAKGTGTGGAASSEASTASVVSATKPATPPSTISDAKTFDPLAQQAQAAIDNRPKTSISFASMEHDFGTIKQDSENKYVFSFTNTGKEPLLIENAQGSCGCTVPNYPKEPIPPGGKGEIEVVYKPGKQENQQNKTVTVTANTEPKQTTLRISANVQKVG
ncbi:MAG TPA: DUF1573 domain-containing protein [Flavobacteriales bacterium]|nr:DUF1573 domain-containing protein [Flavobacteriales bacterium]